jgi:hypothetical protein
MSIATLILGTSGSGKTASLRNMDHDTTLLIQTIAKPLPFKPQKEWKPFVTDDWTVIEKYIQAALIRGRDKVIIDDFQYLLANEFMRRSSEKGYEKFTEIGHHAWSVIKRAAEGPPNLRVYLLSHTDTDDFGRTKAKTIGKMLDDKITIEGMFTIVLRSIVNDGNFQFSTKNNGQDTTKTPMGLFDDPYIDNDLNMVDREICKYYSITPLQPQQEKKA